MGMFTDLINKLEVIDLPMGNQNFTWSNMQRSPTLARLDRFLISTEWDLAFPLSKVMVVPRITSDHSPILLNTGDKLCKRFFRIEEVWLEREDFCERLPTWWSETSNGVLTFNARLRHCRKRMKEWCHTSFYSIANTKKAIFDEIQHFNVLEKRQDLTA